MARVDLSAARDEMWVYLQSLEHGTEQMQRQLKRKLDATIRRLAKRTNRSEEEVRQLLETEARKEQGMVAHIGGLLGR